MRSAPSTASAWADSRRSRTTQRLFPAPDLLDDGVGIGGPDEGLRVLVILVEETIDSGLKVDDAREDAALEPPLRQRGEEALDGVDPRGRRWREMEVKPGVPLQPGAHRRMLVRHIVVDDQMQLAPGGDLAVDAVEKADELLMPVACHALADHLALQHVESGEKRRGAMPLVVVCHRPAAALLHR